MATQYPDLFASLAAPFAEQEVRSRAQSGRQIHYITARTAMNRLDEVLGPEGWWDEYVPGQNSVLCRLTIRLPDGSTLTKADAGGYAGMADSGDDDKSGYSDAFKRAAVKFGVGRYLYRDGVPAFVREREPATAAPGPARPAEGHGPGDGQPSQARPVNAGSAEARANAGHKGNGQAPRSGRALFAWCKEQEQRHEVGLLKYVGSWAKLQDFPGRMVDFDEEQVRLAHAEAVRKLQSVVKGDAYEDALAN